MSDFNQFEMTCISVFDVNFYYHDENSLDLEFDHDEMLEFLKLLSEKRKLQDLIADKFDQQVVDYFDNEMDCIEDYAKENNLIHSEESLKQYLIQYLKEAGDYESNHKLCKDRPMMREFISNTVDNLYQDNRLHEVQTKQYDINLDFSDFNY